MKKEVKAIEIFCDCCGEHFTTEDGFCSYSGDEDGSLIEDEAVTSDWIRAGKLHFCPKCYKWNDDDTLQINDGRRFTEEGELIEQQQGK